MTDREPLEVFLDFADKVTDLANAREVPAYSETCMCGASVVVGQATSRVDLRRIHANFLGRHRTCAGPDAADPGEDA